MEDDSCADCDKEIRDSDKLVKCDGVCNRVFHYKCIGFNVTAYRFYCQCRNLKYICDDCTEHPDNMMNGMIKKLLSYLCIIDERLNRHGDGLMSMKSDIESEMAMIKDKEDICSPKVSARQEMKDECAVVKEDEMTKEKVPSNVK
ncbi:hypothetical protein Bhyg_07782, partial [Pseudolycoriella hygida]